MELLVTERDFASVGVHPADVDRLNLDERVSSGGEEIVELRKAVMDALPKVLLEKVGKIWNVLEGYELTSFDVRVNVAGKPFGVGLEGEMTLHLSRTK